MRLVAQEKSFSQKNFPAGKAFRQQLYTPEQGDPLARRIFAQPGAAKGGAIAVCAFPTGRTVCVWCAELGPVGKAGTSQLWVSECGEDKYLRLSLGDKEVSVRQGGCRAVDCYRHKTRLLHKVKH